MAWQHIVDSEDVILKEALLAKSPSSSQAFQAIGTKTKQLTQEATEAAQ